MKIVAATVGLLLLIIFFHTLNTQDKKVLEDEEEYNELMVKHNDLKNELNEFKNTINEMKVKEYKQFLRAERRNHQHEPAYSLRTKKKQMSQPW